MQVIRDVSSIREKFEKRPLLVFEYGAPGQGPVWCRAKAVGRLMPKASNTGARWGVAATMMLGVVLGPLALAGPSAAVPPPPPPPHPPEWLRPILLAPLAPILTPSARPPAPGGGAPSQPRPNSGVA